MANPFTTLHAPFLAEREESDRSKKKWWKSFAPAGRRNHHHVKMGLRAISFVLVKNQKIIPYEEFAEESFITPIGPRTPRPPPMSLSQLSLLSEGKKGVEMRRGITFRRNAYRSEMLTTWKIPIQGAALLRWGGGLSRVELRRQR